MKKNILVVLGALSVLLAGCRSYVETTYVPAQQQQPPAPRSPLQIKTEVAEDSFSIESAVNTKLRLKVIYGNAESTFSRKVAERLINAVLLDNAELTLSDPCDAVVVLMPEFEVVDSDNDTFCIDSIKYNNTTKDISSKEDLKTKLLEILNNGE